MFFMDGYTETRVIFRTGKLARQSDMEDRYSKGCVFMKGRSTVLLRTFFPELDGNRVGVVYEKLRENLQKKGFGQEIHLAGSAYLLSLAATARQAGALPEDRSAGEFYRMMLQGEAFCFPFVREDAFRAYFRRQVPVACPACCWNLLDEFSPEEFAACVFLDREQAPGKVARELFVHELAMQLLEICSGERVADLSCCAGDFLLSAGTREEALRLHGIEKSPELAGITALRVKIILAREKAGKIPIGLPSEFFLDWNSASCFFGEDKFSEEHKVVYDKVFAAYPCGVKVSDMEQDCSYVRYLREADPVFLRGTSAVWCYNRLLKELLAPGGKAVGLIRRSDLEENGDSRVRRYFLSQGYVEAVVDIPLEIGEERFVLMVFSHGNKAVRFIDAATDFRESANRNRLAEDIRRGLDGGFPVRDIPVEEILAMKDCVLVQELPVPEMA